MIQFEGRPTSQTRLEKDFKRFRWLFAFATLYYILWFFANSFAPKNIHIHLFEYRFIYLFGMRISLTSLVVWYTWTKFPIDDEKKKSHTLMVIILGIVGMWLWLPNREERKQLFEHLDQHNKQ